MIDFFSVPAGEVSFHREVLMQEDMGWVGAVVVVTLILTVGGVILLRPIAQRLGEFLEVLIQEKRAFLQSGSTRSASAPPDLAQRVAHLEQRLDFTERLLSDPREEETTPGGGPRLDR
jgi:hypothetical protein